MKYDDLVYINEALSEKYTKTEFQLTNFTED